MTAPVTVAVVGAGPAGMMAAIAAAECGAKVLLLEQLRRPGVKLLATGGGRCNITNLTPTPAFLASFGRQGRFMAPAIDLLGPAALREFFARLGLPTVVEEGVYVFPASGRAADVQAALARRCGQLGVETLTSCAVTGLTTDGGAVKGVVCSDGRAMAADRVVLACGGKSWPELGGTGGGYDLARQAGHTIVEPTPALVPLITREKWPEKLAGVSLPAARVWIDLPRQSKAGLAGGLLLTHHGLSGPAILNLSGAVAGLLAATSAPVPIRVEWSAGVDVAAWRGRFDQWRTQAGARAIVNL
ncbi:MAG: aminoacetone oxidase family FAD-binding enzyme, partial [Planctomycetota bacterium]|nr:aminoacetone oxidase family FAD-binding enzyme [Planctomycetota bacterium]